MTWPVAPPQLLHPHSFLFPSPFLPPFSLPSVVLTPLPPLLSPQRLPHCPRLLLHTLGAPLLLPARKDLPPQMGAATVRTLHRALR